MPWHEDGSDWTGKTAAELRPVIVSLCNAVGDRYQCIGLDRPEWPVNEDQDIISVTLGTKGAALEEADLYGLDIFRYGWWTMIADHITALVNLGSGSLTVAGSTHCRGWSKTATSTGLGSDLWTIADLETDVGLGTLSQSAIGGTMHLFDEAAPNRLREFLDRLLYPVVFPQNLVDDAYSWLSSGALADILSQYSHGTDPGDGDDAWGALTGAGALHPLLSNEVIVTVDLGAGSIADYLKRHYVAFNFEGVQNGVGYLGTVEKQYYVVAYRILTLVGGDVTFMGGTVSMAGTDALEYDEFESTDSLTITGVQEIPFEIGNFTRTPSPFNGLRFGDDGYGYAYASISCLFGLGGITRAQASRIILDISDHCADQ